MTDLRVSPDHDRRKGPKDRNRNRRTIRLKKYDYSDTGEYFITLCTDKKQCFLGRINNHKIILNDCG